MRKRVKEMEDEAAKLREMQAQVEREMSLSGIDLSATNNPEVDKIRTVQKQVDEVKGVMLENITIRKSRRLRRRRKLCNHQPKRLCIEFRLAFHQKPIMSRFTRWAPPKTDVSCFEFPTPTEVAQQLRATSNEDFRSIEAKH